MKKIILTSIAALCMACPSYATTVSGSGNECNEPILGTDTGPATLRATWDANTININWYSDDTKITPTNNTANTCTYDSVITLPTNTMNKTGYTFGGWRVRAAAGPVQCNISDITSLNTSTNGSAFAYINFDGTESTANSSIARKTPDTYNISTPGEWATEFSYGTIKGISRCSTLGSGYTMGQTGNPTDDLNAEGAQYCWCQLTGFDADKDGEYCAVASLWVFRDDYGSAASCASYCSLNCGSGARSFEALRVGLFGSVASN